MENDYTRELEERLAALTAEVSELKEKLENKSAGEGVHYDFSRIKALFDDGMGKLMEALKPIAAKANSRIAEPAKAVVHKTEEKVANNPFTAIMIALSAGVIIGKVLDICCRDYRCCCGDDED